MNISTESEELPRCPICLEIPHNAVLLICSSSNCHPFICDTSSRHSNCLDQYRKSSSHELVCPLCRGAVSRCVVVDEVRKLLNSKTRSCSLETCDFSGNYGELRKHARREHPSVRPSAVSPTRQSNWEALQLQIDTEDAAFAQAEQIIMDIDVYLLEDQGYTIIGPPSPILRMFAEADLDIDSDGEDYYYQCSRSQSRQRLEAEDAYAVWENSLHSH